MGFTAEHALHSIPYWNHRTAEAECVLTHGSDKTHAFGGDREKVASSRGSKVGCVGGSLSGGESA